MKSYKCLQCDNIVKSEYIRKKIRCPYCGGKILYKTRTATTEVEAV